MKDINKYRGVIPAFYACYDKEGAISVEGVKALTRHLNQLSKEKDLAAQRYQKFRAMGVVREENEI